MFDWDEHNETHIATHDLSPEEAEEALFDPRRIGVAAYDVAGDERRGIIGATLAGRILFVVITRRGDLIRVVTARDGNEREKKRYRRKGK